MIKEKAIFIEPYYITPNYTAEQHYTEPTCTVLNGSALR